jgi:predicted transcriptional regulator
VETGQLKEQNSGITGDTMRSVAMTLRLTDEETDALRRRARREGRSMQDVARSAIRDYIDQSSRRELLEAVLDEELPRYAEALRRLGE